MTQWKIPHGRHNTALLAALVIISLLLLMASPPATGQVSPWWEGKDLSEIQDNSFFIEEAYNQLEGSMQHKLNAVLFTKPGKDATYSLTQEWALGSRRHQMSFTLPYYSLNNNAVLGVGDIALNYRYQLFDDRDWAFVAPRISVVLPSGDMTQGLGDGSLGVQFNLPISMRVADALVGHLNLGFTALPKARSINSEGQELVHAANSVNGGASLVWVAGNSVNLLLEYYIDSFREIEGLKTERETEQILTPGVRFAINAGEARIVPAIALPIALTSGESRRGIFMHLSLEHPL